VKTAGQSAQDHLDAKGIRKNKVLAIAFADTIGMFSK